MPRPGRVKHEQNVLILKAEVEIDTMKPWFNLQIHLNVIVRLN